MKKSFLLAFLFVSLGLGAIAQTKKGQVTYTMSFSSDDPDMSMVSAMMEGSQMILSFEPGKSRAEVTMGMMGNMVTIVSDKDDKMLMLMDMMGMKYAVETDMTTEENNQDTDMKVEVTSEKKKICGYNCTKAIMTDAAGSTKTIWFTKDLSVYVQGHQYFNNQMPGFPLGMSIAENGMTIDITAKEVLKTVDSKVFSMAIPAGYELKTMEELEMMNGGEE